MSKREFAALFVALLGCWLLVMMIISLLNPLFALVSAVWNAPVIAGGRFELLWPMAIGMVGPLLFAILGWQLISRSHAIASALLKHARIDGEGRIDGIQFATIAPVAYSLLGLYLLVSHGPNLVINAVRWFSLEAQAVGMLGSGTTESQVAQYRQALLEGGLVVGAAALIFRRPDLIDRMVKR